MKIVLFCLFYFVFWVLTSTLIARKRGSESESIMYGLYWPIALPSMILRYFVKEYGTKKRTIKVMTKLDKVMFVWYAVIAFITGISVGLLIGMQYFK